MMIVGDMMGEVIFHILLRMYLQLNIYVSVVVPYFFLHSTKSLLYCSQMFTYNCNTQTYCIILEETHSE
jgi:hypothetical protein